MKKLLILCLFLISCTTISSVEINNINIPVELAITDEEKAQGLMSRESLEGGMLFIYNEENQRNFWMKNTLIPLDIVFIGEGLEINVIHHAIPCKEDPCKIYSGNAEYVLEVNANFTINNNINEGDKVMFIKKQ